MTIHMEKVKGHLVQKLEWKQMDSQTDGADCITCLANAVGKYARWYDVLQNFFLAELRNLVHIWQ